MKPKPPEPKEAFSVRVPASLAREIKALATESFVSVNEWFVAVAETAAEQRVLVERPAVRVRDNIAFPTATRRDGAKKKPKPRRQEA